MMNEDDLATRAERAAKAHNEAVARATEAEEAYAKARADYAVNPTEPGGAAVFRTRDAAELARARRQHFEAALAAVQAEVEAAEVARIAAEAEVERVAEAARRVELRREASLASYQARTCDAVDTVLAAEAKMREALAHIEGEFARSQALARELRALGEDVPPLDVLHVLGPILAKRLASGLGSAALVERHLNESLRHPVYVPGGAEGTVSTAFLLQSFLATFDPKCGSVSPAAELALAEELEARLSARTYVEADEAVKELRNRRAEEARAAKAQEAARAAAGDDDVVPVHGPGFFGRALAFLSPVTPTDDKPAAS
jgi:hypothetical protein